jgi:hypothetical protein
MSGRRWRFSAWVCAWLLAGCELAEVTTALPDDVVVAEVFLRVSVGEVDAVALLHRTAGPTPIAGASVQIRLPGEEWTPFDGPLGSFCAVGELPLGLRPSCFVLRGPPAARLLVPGHRLEVEVRWPGGAMSGATTIPGTFELRTPREASCRLRPHEPLPLVWTGSSGAWAYLPETLIFGLKQALAPDGISVGSDPLMLQGLSISQSDTTIVFPGQFGLFERFSDDSDAILAIQGGLPTGVTAQVIITALDRNAVNWLRGGTFNPSGPVRIPSLFGDGTGVVGSLVNRFVDVAVEGDAAGGVSCR